MGLVVLTTLLTLVVMATSDSPPQKKVYYDVADARNHFDAYIKEYNKEYKDDADKELHYQAFYTNLGKINDLNKKSPNAVFGINKFADYTEEESRNMRGFKKNKD